MFVVFNQAKSTEIVYKSLSISSALYQQYIFANMDFPLYFIRKTPIGTIWIFERFARGSD